MKFKSKVAEPNRGVTESVFDPKTEKIIAVGKNGMIEAEEESVVERLKELGYQAIAETEAKPPAPEKNPKKKGKG